MLQKLSIPMSSWWWHVSCMTGCQQYKKNFTMYVTDNCSPALKQSMDASNFKIFLVITNILLNKFACRFYCCFICLMFLIQKWYELLVEMSILEGISAEELNLFTLNHQAPGCSFISLSNFPIYIEGQKEKKTLDYAIFASYNAFNLSWMNQLL